MTPLPNIGISDRHQRWDYFTTDTLPGYLDLVETTGQRWTPS